MAGGHSENAAFDGNRRWLAALAFLGVGAAFFGLWFWLLDQWFEFPAGIAGAAGWRWIAAVPAILGFSIALRCVWDFGRTGRGTPAPFAPPQRLVVVGFYRHVRNPIYVGAAAGWIGLWIVFDHVSLAGTAEAALAAMGVHLFVTLYEEPTLRRKFGPDYDEYCRNVHRWWPRLRGWDSNLRREGSSV